MGDDAKWLPIETAPRDGREFLAYWRLPNMETLQPGEGQIVIARWIGDCLFGPGFYGVNVRDNHGHGSIARMSWGFPKDELRATHWRPLPPPPKQEDSA